MIKIILGTIVFLFLGFGSGNVFANTQIFDDGSSIQSFDDGSRLITDIDGKVTSTNATDWTTKNSSQSPSTTAKCDYDGNWDISAALKKCKPNGMIEAKDNYEIAGGARQRIVDIANQIIAIGALLSVGAIVYAAFLYVAYAGDEDRVKHAKSSLKFGIIGFVVMLLSFPIVNMIVGLVYSVGG